MPTKVIGLGLGCGQQGSFAPTLIEDGLLAAWDLTNRAAGTQTVAGALGTSYTLTAGHGGTVDGGDPFAWNTYGASMNNAGDNDYFKTPLPATATRGDKTIIVVASVQQIGSTIISAQGGWNMSVVGGKLTFQHGNNDLGRLWTDGPNAPYGSYNSHFRVYTVQQTEWLSEPPVLWVNETPTECSTSTSYGVATGAQPLGWDEMRVGSFGSFNYPFLTVAYVMVYNRRLADGEIVNTVGALRTNLASAGVTIP